MRLSFLSALAVVLAADAAVASTWFGKAAYNKWHETELERWLSDHEIPYPTPADRADLEKLVKENWNAKVGSPYQGWDASQLQQYLSSRGQQAKKGSEKNKDSLVGQVKAYWFETEEQASESYNNVKEWVFDTWSDSQLKAFCDRHGIPVPQPRTRDGLLKTARENYQSAASKLGETASYPGDWLYEAWSESDLKAWLDERGIPVPQTSTRDKLIASVRRNSRLASNYARAASASAASSAQAAQSSLSDALLGAWSDSQIKELLDKNGIKVPQGSRRNELIALVRKHRAKLTGDNIASSASSYYGAATSNAGNQYAKATDDAAMKRDRTYQVVGSYIDWIKQKLGLAASSAASGTAQASASGESAVSAASSSSKSAVSAASASAESASDAAKKSASKLGKAASDAATESATSLKDRAGEATDYAKEEL